MLTENWSTTLGSVIQSRCVFTAEALKTRSETAHAPHLLLGRVMGDKDKDKDSDLSSLIRTGVGRRPTLTSRTEHLSRLKPDLPTNRPKTMGAGST